MEEMWKKISKTKNIEYLTKVSEMATFLAKKKFLYKLEKLLRNIKN